VRSGGWRKCWTADAGPRGTTSSHQSAIPHPNLRGSATSDRITMSD
jgi:hypothetical protein